MNTNWKTELDKLNIHPTPGENGWPDAMHVPSVHGLLRGKWVNTCGTRGCLVGHVGCAFLDGPYVKSVAKAIFQEDAEIGNNDLPEQAADFLRLLVVRLGVSVEDVRCRHGVQGAWVMASDLFEHGCGLDGERPSFEEVVEAWLDVTEYCGYVVTPALRKKVLKG